MALVVYSLHCTARKSLKGNECARNEHHKSTSLSKGITCCCCHPPKQQQQQRQVHRVHPLPVPLLRNEQQEKKKERKKEKNYKSGSYKRVVDLKIPHSSPSRSSISSRQTVLLLTPVLSNLLLRPHWAMSNEHGSLFWWWRKNNKIELWMMTGGGEGGSSKSKQNKNEKLRCRSFLSVFGLI